MVGFDMTKYTKDGKESRSIQAVHGYHDRPDPACNLDDLESVDTGMDINVLRLQYEDIRWTVQKNEFNRAEFWKIFDHAGIAAVVIDDNTTIVRANRQFEILTSLRRSGIEGKLDWAWFLAGNPTDLLRKIDHQLRRGPLSVARQTYEVRVSGRGKKMWNAKIVISKIPKTRWSLAFITEASSPGPDDARAGNESLQVHGTRHLSRDGVLIADRNGIVIDLNEPAEHITGWRECDAVGKPIGEILKLMQETKKNGTGSPDEGLMAPVLAEREEQNGVLLTKDKSLIPLTYRISSLLSETNDVTGCLVEFSEKCAPGHPRNFHAAREVRNNPVIRNPRDIMYALDEKGHIAFISPEIENLGFSQREVISSDFTGFVHPDDRQNLVRKFSAASEQANHVFTSTFRFVMRNNTVCWMESSGTIRPDGIEKKIFITGVMRDISDRMIKEHALMETNKKLCLLNNFTRHDIRNQLLALQGYADCALAEKNGPVVSYLLDRILLTAQAISKDIEFTKTYQNLGTWSTRWFRISDVVRRTSTRIVRISDTCKGIEIYTDPMIEQILFNLFDNASRHGGNVTEIVVACGQSKDGLMLVIEDNGIGIPASDKERIFDRGFGKNTGLGLFLIREVLAITGIIIRETGTEGNGARFEIIVPKDAYRFS